MLIWTMIAFYVLGLVNTAVGWTRLDACATDHRSLESEQDMGAYKALVATQMYLALAQIVLLLVPVAIYFYGAITGRLGTRGLVVVLFMSTVIIVLSKVMKRTASDIKAIPCATTDLATERERVVSTWDRRPFPDW